MKQRSDKCHVRMKPDFLFDLKKRFKSEYTSWIYICFKLADVRKVGYEPNKFFKVDRDTICKLLHTNTSTITREVQKLISYGLIEQKGREYRILNNDMNSIFEDTEGFPKHIRIYNNFLIDFFERLNQEYPDIENKDRSVIKTAEVFFYLIAKNRHCLIKTPILESDETSKTISAFLNHDEDCVKEYLEALESIGQIEIDEDGKIKTLYGYGRSERFKKIPKERRNYYETNMINNEDEIKEDDYQNEPVQFELNEESILKSVDEHKKPVQSELKEESILKSVDEHKEYVQAPEPITDREKIRMLEIMANGNSEKFKNLLLKYNISLEDNLKNFNNNNKINNSKSINSEIKNNITEDEILEEEDELSEEERKQHLDFKVIYNVLKKFPDNNERRKIFYVNLISKETFDLFLSGLKDYLGEEEFNSWENETFPGHNENKFDVLWSN